MDMGLSAQKGRAVRLHSSSTREPWIVAAIDDGTVVLFEDSKPRMRSMLDSGSVEVSVDGRFVARCASGSGKVSNPLLGINQLCESDLEDLTVWIPRRGKHAQGIEVSVDLNNAWSVQNVRTGYLQVEQAGLGTELVYFDPMESQFLPISPNHRFAASGFFATRECRAEIAVQFFDHELVLLAEATQLINDARGEPSPDRIPNTIVAGVVPDAASYARFFIRIVSAPRTKPCSVFFSQPWFGYIGKDLGPSVAPSPYAPSVLSWVRFHGPFCRTSRLPLPQWCFDGRAHSIHVVDERSRMRVRGSPLQVSPHSDFRGIHSDLG
jgi:hypothetical protein